MNSSTCRPPEDLTTHIDWLNANIDLSSISKQSKQDLIITSCKYLDFNDAGGLNSYMRKLQLTFLNDESCIVIVKYNAPSVRGKDLGTPRESHFYQLFIEKMQFFDIKTPEVYYTYGDMLTGEKLLILKYLKDSTQSGYFFGSNSPLNWNKDLDAITQSITNEIIKYNSLYTYDYLAKHIAYKAMQAAAQMHAYYWRNHVLLTADYNWLRGIEWYSCFKSDSTTSDESTTWINAQKTCVNVWKSLSTKILEGNTGDVKWNPFLVKCIQASVDNISWTTYQQELKDNRRSWTLVHGDFHPANMMFELLQVNQDHALTSDDEDSSSSYLKAFDSNLVILDWELVGIGNGPQDIAQYVISHFSPDFRRSIEVKLIEFYYQQLSAEIKRYHGEEGLESFNQTYSLQKCREEYVSGGVERWIWLLIVLASMCPDKMVQYFHDQVYEFIIDHNVKPEDIGMPRV